MPVGEKSVDREGLGVTEGGQESLGSRKPNESGSKSPRLRRRSVDVERNLAVGRQHRSRHARRKKVEGIIVVTEEFGGASERIDDSRSQFLFQDRHDGVPDSNASERGVVVVRVLPRGDPLRGTRGDGGVPRHREEWPSDDPIEGGHSTDAPWTRPARQPEKHRFGLVVSGVARENGDRRSLRRDRDEFRITGLPRRSFRPSHGSDAHASHDRVEPALAKCSCRQFRHLGAVRLKTVIDDRRDEAQIPL